MRRKHLAILLPSLLLSISLSAMPKEGFYGPFQGVSTVALAKMAADETFVMLTGNILAYLGNDNYQFEDETGVIEVEIGSDKWRGLSITPDTTVILSGTINKEFDSSPSINIKRIGLSK